MLSKLTTSLTAALVLLGLAAPGAANADLLYSNPAPVGDPNGDCGFASSCVPTMQRFAAQQFTLGNASTITSIGYSEFQSTYDYPGSYVSPNPSAVDYIILLANGVGGLPGTEVASGSAVPTVTSSSFPTTDWSFNISAVTLGLGTYYVALHEVTTTVDYLEYGIPGGGGAESKDGGATWVSGFSGNPYSVVVSLFGTVDVPEPATMALLGVGLVGAAVVRKRA